MKDVDFCVLMESVSEPFIEIIEDRHDKSKTSDSVTFLRFRSKMQSFGKRTLNGRSWPVNIVRQMMNAPIPTRMLTQKGGIPGEAGHPVPSTGKVTVERIMTIDPERINFIAKKYEWDGDKAVYGILETIDDGPSGPGRKLRNRILQGIMPSFSVRCLVPQRKNMDGTIDVVGMGTFVCHDNVIIDACEDCFMTQGVPIQKITKNTELEYATESYSNLLMECSEKTCRILDGLYPAMESATIDSNGTFSVKTEKMGHIFLNPELKYRREYKDILNSFK